MWVRMNPVTEADIDIAACLYAREAFRCLVWWLVKYQIAKRAPAWLIESKRLIWQLNRDVPHLHAARRLEEVKEGLAQNWRGHPGKAIRCK
jgi:hypothetical protein